MGLNVSYCGEEGIFIYQLVTSEEGLKHVKFTHGFILAGNLKILLLSYPGTDRSATAAEVSNTYQFITLSLHLNPAVT